MVHPTTPTVTLSTFAKVLAGAPVDELLPLVHSHKEESEGRPRAHRVFRAGEPYRTALRQAVGFMTEGAPFDLSAARAPRERAAIWALVIAPPRAPRWSRVLRGKRRPAWDLGGLLVKANPDVEIDGGRERGAAKIVLTKQPLSEATGAVMASLLFHVLAEVSEEPAIARTHCLVYEPRAHRVFRASEGPRDVARHVPAAVAVIRGLWGVV